MRELDQPSVDGGSRRTASVRQTLWLGLEILPAAFSYFPEHLLKIIFCNLRTQAATLWQAASQPGWVVFLERASGEQRVRLGLWVAAARPPHMGWRGLQTLHLAPSAALFLIGMVLTEVIWPSRSLEENPWIASDIIAYRFMRVCGFFIKHVVKCYKMKP